MKPHVFEKLNPTDFEEKIRVIVAKLNLAGEYLADFSASGVSFKDNQEGFYFEGTYRTADFPLTIENKMKRKMLGVTLVQIYNKSKTDDVITGSLWVQAFETDAGIKIYAPTGIDPDKNYFMRFRIE